MKVVLSAHTWLCCLWPIQNLSKRLFFSKWRQMGSGRMLISALTGVPESDTCPSAALKIQLYVHLLTSRPTAAQSFALAVALWTCQSEFKHRVTPSLHIIDSLHVLQPNSVKEHYAFFLRSSEVLNPPSSSLTFSGICTTGKRKKEKKKTTSKHLWHIFFSVHK